MSVTFEWLCPTAAIVRLHPAKAAQYGDPYVWWTVGVIRAEGTLELKGADRPLPTGGVQALCLALKTAGFKRRVHQRIVDGSTRTVSKELSDLMPSTFAKAVNDSCQLIVASNSIPFNRIQLTTRN